MKWFAKRLAQMIPVVFGVVTLVFAFLRMVPGDPVTIMLGEQARPADIETMRKDLGLDGTMAAQYGRFIKGLCKGDLGKSFYFRKPVRDVIFERYPATMQLAGCAMLVAVLISFPLGIIAAMRSGTAVDAAASGFALLGVSMPNFWLGPLLILLFSIHLQLTPVSGGGGFKYLILPAITLGMGMSGILARLVRSGLLEVQGAAYIRTAVAKGLGRGRVVLVHGLRNALLPVVTVMGLQFGALLAGAVVTETVFSWPGVGYLLIEAIRSRDYPLVQGCVLSISATYVLVNLLVDALYAVIDPRIRLEGSK